MRALSLRARLLAGMAVIAAVLVAASVVVVRSTEDHLIGQVDEQLAATGRPVRDLVAGEGGPRRAVAERFSDLHVAVLLPTGEVATLVTPFSLGDHPPPPDLDAQAIAAAARTGEPFTVGSDGSVRYRALARVEGLRGTTSVVARPLSEVDDAVERLTAVLAAAVLAVLGVLALVAWWVVRLGVRPIKSMTETAGAIAAGDLSRRVPEEAPGTEAGDLGVALNQMLGQIEEAFERRQASEERLRQFVADASHELRTPVTTIRGYAELHRAGGLPPGERLDEAMRRTEQEAVRMGQLIDDLLQLARLDQGRPLVREPVDLAAVARDAAADAAAVDPGRAVRAVVEGEVVVLADEARVRQVVANLVGNALVHTPTTAAVVVSARTDGDDALLEVHDDGPGMAPEVVARAFERFYRADPARSRHRGGTGLGLSIVEATVRAHGGTVEITSAPGEGTTVQVRLPRRDHTSG